MPDSKVDLKRPDFRDYKGDGSSFDYADDCSAYMDALESRLAELGSQLPVQPADTTALLYKCIRELAYVQDVPDSLKASSLGKELIEEGMKLLAIPDLAEDDIEQNTWYPKWKAAIASRGEGGYEQCVKDALKALEGTTQPLGGQNSGMVFKADGKDNIAALLAPVTSPTKESGNE